MSFFHWITHIVHAVNTHMTIVTRSNHTVVRTHQSGCKVQEELQLAGVCVGTKESCVLLSSSCGPHPPSCGEQQQTQHE